MYLFGSLWPRWQLAFKIVTPILHVAFSATQIHGSMVLFRMYRRQLILGGHGDPDVEHANAPEADNVPALADEESKSKAVPKEGLNSA